MRISRIKLKNILGHEELELTPAGITEISGKNGAGKSSVIEAIKAAIGGTKKAEQAKLIRKGAEDAEVVLVLDDGLKITRRLDIEGKNTLSVFDPATKGRYGQTFLDELVDGLAVNPVSFLTASEKERAAIMLEAIPMELDRAELGSMVEGFGLRTIPEKGHPLQLIDAADKELREQRKNLKRDMDDRLKTANTLHESLPDEPEGTNWAAVLEEAEAERESLRHAQSEATAKAQNTLGEAKVENGNNFNEALRKAAAKRDERVAELQRLIQEANNEYAAAEGRCREFKANLDAKAQATYGETVAGIQAEYGPKLDEVNARITEAKTKAEASIRGQEVKRLIDEKRDEAQQLEEAWDKRNMAIENLEKLKRRLTSNLPIEGLEVTAGAISVNGVPFETLNTAAKVKVAFEVAALRAKKLGVICCDGLEVLDAETLAEFYQQAEGTGLQLIVTRVTDGPFTVTTK